MTDAHRAASDLPPRPPWQTALIGVRCPSCGLGGDIPESIVRTVCPRCTTVFEVALARAERPAPQPEPVTEVRESTPLPPITAIPLPPIPTIEYDEPETWIEPLAPDDPLSLAGLALIPARSSERPSPSEAPRPSTTTVPRSSVARPRRRVRTATLGASMFALGLMAGWTVFRDDGETELRADAPTEVRDAVVDRDATAIERNITDGGGDSDGAADAASGDPSAAGTSASGESTSGRTTPRKQSSSEKKSAAKASSRETSDTKASGRKSSGRSSNGSTTTTDRDRTTTTRAGAADRPAGASASTTVAAAPATTIGAAPPATPSVSFPAVRACSGLDCHMTAPSGFAGIPIPDDAVELTTPTGVLGWTTHVAGIEELTAWYLDHLTEMGWVLNGPASVMDPAEGELRDLGHSTSAVYCPSDSDDPIVAVNVGWPDDDTSGDTIVLGLVSGIDESACN